MSTTSPWHRVGMRAEIESRKLRRVRLASVWIALHVWHDTVYAIEDACPHRGATLSNGEVGVDGYVSCPEHGWEYHLHTGIGRQDWEGCIERYETREDPDGSVWVRTPALPAVDVNA